MSDAVTFIMLIVAIVLLALAFRFFLRWSRADERRAQKKQLRTQTDESGKVDFVRCPLCNTPLAKDENLSSTVYRPMNVPDQRMTVNGCPHCYPRPESGIVRSCPVCGKHVAADGYLVARLFNKPSKKHVIVTGCTGCLRIK